MDFLTWLRAEWDRVAGFTLIGLGAIAVALGFHGVASSPFVAEELAYIASGGIGGLFLLGCGMGLLISADLKDEWRKLDEIAASLRPEAGDSPPPSNEATARTGRKVAVGGALLLLAGLAAIAFGWQRAGGESDPDPAIRAVGVAVVGLVVAAAAIALAVLWGKWKVSERSTRLLLPYAAVALAGVPAPVVAPATDRVVIANGLARYHRPGCVALEGLRGREVDRSKVPPKLAPCQLCSAG